jgi:hypothetical protein
MLDVMNGKFSLSSVSPAHQVSVCDRGLPFKIVIEVKIEHLRIENRKIECQMSFFVISSENQFKVYFATTTKITEKSKAAITRVQVE